ncbi:unnamed protein product, partial [Iphiclides podalirius]
MPQPGEQHYEPDLDVCTLAKICNHTGSPECGKEKNDLDKRIFLDQCDRFEFNCDYNKDYINIPYDECKQDTEERSINNLSTKEIFTTSELLNTTESNFERQSSKAPHSDYPSKTNRLKIPTQEFICQLQLLKKPQNMKKKL